MPSVWTTADEMKYINELYRASKVRVLRNWITNWSVRNWHDKGMSVEPTALLIRAKTCLDILEKSNAVDHSKPLPDWAIAQSKRNY